MFLYDEITVGHPGLLAFLQGLICMTRSSQCGEVHVKGVRCLWGIEINPLSAIHNLFSEICKLCLVKRFGEEISKLEISGTIFEFDFLVHYQLLKKS